MKSINQRILEDLSQEQPDYAPFIASRLGLHLRYVENQCEVCVDRGLLERPNGTVKYRLTDRGERCLEEEADAVNLDKRKE